jgi:hypothetical protein
MGVIQEFRETTGFSKVFILGRTDGQVGHSGAQYWQIICITDGNS